MEFRFYKLRVCDHDVLLLDADRLEPAGEAEEGRPGGFSGPALAPLLLDRRRGVGAESLALVRKSATGYVLEAWDRRGKPRACPYDAAACAARYLMDSGAGGRSGLALEWEGRLLSLEALDGAAFGMELGAPRAYPGGEPLDAAALAARRTGIEIAGRRCTVLPLGLGTAGAPVGGSGGDAAAAVTAKPESSSAAGASAAGAAGAAGPFAAVLFSDGAGGKIHAAARPKDPEPLPVRMLSREELQVSRSGRGALDASASGALALAAAAGLGMSGGEALVRLRGGGLYAEWLESGTLYVAVRPEYVHRGEIHLED